MAVNFWGTVNTTKAFLPLLEARPVAALKVGIVFPGGIATNILDNSGVSGPTMSEADAEKAAGSLTSAPDAAAQIVSALESGAPRVVIGRDARMLDRLSRIMPVRAIPMIAKKMRDLLG